MATQTETAIVDNALLSALKCKKHAEVLSLLEREVTIHSTEQSTGRQYIHYAAKGGSTEVVTRLLELGADINEKDKDENTPLHLAVKEKHEDMVALVVSRGANLKITNKSKQSPLLIAINEKQHRIVEMLLRFEQEISVTEWDWDVQGSKLGKQEKKVIEAMERQCALIPGIKNSLVHCGIYYVRPEEELSTDYLQLDTDSIRSPFVFQCDRIQLEYTNIKRYLNMNEEFFSDIYECRTWACKERDLKLRVTVNDYVPTGRTLKFISVENSKGDVEPDYDVITDDQNNQKTVVTVSVCITNCEYSKFTIATVEKEEQIQVSREAAVLKPIMSPGTEIAIPENTFNKESQLSIKVMDTEETNREEEQCMIATDALMIHTSDHVQPEKQVSMKLPIHTQINVNPSQNGIIVLASKDDHPDSVDDWEMLEPSESANTESLSFKVNHFSVFVGVARSWTQKSADIEKLHQVIENTIARRKKVVFMVFTRDAEADGYQSVGVQCVSSKKHKPASVEWENKGYSLVMCSDSHICTSGSIFQIELCGNISELHHSKKMQLPFLMHKENKIVFKVTIVDNTKPAEGKINIQSSEKKIFTEQIQEVESGCLGIKKIKVKDIEREHTELKDVCSCDLKILKKDSDITSSDDVRKKYKKMFSGFRVQRELLKKISGSTNHQE